MSFAGAAGWVPVIFLTVSMPQRLWAVIPLLLWVMTDNSGPILPAPGPALPPSQRSEAGITLNGRTLTLAAALLLGGGVGGGGLSVLQNPTKEISGLRQDIESLKSTTETVAIAAVEIKADMNARNRDLHKAETKLEELTKRVRVLEQAD